MSDLLTVNKPEAAAPTLGFDPVAQPWQADTSGLPALKASVLTPTYLRQSFQEPRDWSPEVADDSRQAVLERDTLIAAAVLMPLVMRPEGLRVLLTKRTDHLHHHAGQISFPGGRAQASDTTLIDTALRETEEETGLVRHHVDVLGTLPDYPTTSGFRVTPVVGLAVPEFSLAHDPFEVAEVFEVPLEFLMDPANHRLHTAILVNGLPRRYYSMPFENRFIWGATAGMLRNLYHMLRS